MLRLPKIDHASPNPHSPIITLSLTHKGAALLNLHHTAPSLLHIIVTATSQLEAYQKSWSNHIIAAVPDSALNGLGNALNTVKRLAHWNYQQNRRLSSGEAERWVWPCVLLMSDNCCVLKQVEGAKQPIASSDKR